MDIESVDTKQVLYKAICDPMFGKTTFSKIPITGDLYNNYKDVAFSIRSHYEKYDNPISKEALIGDIKYSYKIKGKLTDLVIPQIEELVGSIYQLNQSGNYNYASDPEINKQIDGWCRNKLVANIFSKYLTENKDFSSSQVIESMTADLSEALTIGSPTKDVEHISLADADPDKLVNILSNINKNIIPTGWTDLDKAMGGGLGKGEMALVIGPTGRGKTTTLINLAKQYILYSKKHVQFIELEEHQDRMLLKNLSTITHIAQKKFFETNKLGQQEINKGTSKKVIELVQKAMKDGRIGTLDIDNAPAHKLDINGLEQLIQRYGNEHSYYPDVLIIDYPDIMLNEYQGKVNEYRADGLLYEDIRALAGKYKMLVWVAAQTNRTAAAQDIVNAYSLEGSKQKLNAVELAMTLNQTDEEYKSGFIRFYLDKIRNSTGIEDRMLKLKVDTKYVGFINETTADKEAHDQILSKVKDENYGKYKKAQETDADRKRALAKINKINEHIMNE